MACHGNSDSHCCYLRGKVCEYLEENTMPDRRWVCGLMREHQDWDKVLEDERYKKNVAPKWVTVGNCRDWPDNPATKCFECGFGVEPDDHGAEKWL